MKKFESQIILVAILVLVSIGSAHAQTSKGFVAGAVEDPGELVAVGAGDDLAVRARVGRAGEGERGDESYEGEDSHCPASLSEPRGRR